MDLNLSHIDPDILATCSESDKIEYAMCQSEDKVECPLTHIFTPGLYTRTIFMPAGSLIMSMTHNTRHPFIISTGEVDVISPEGSVTHVAPYMGITQPGTKRFLHVKQDTTWTTFHVNPENLTDPDQIVEIISDRLQNPLLDPDDSKCKTWSKDVSSSLIINAISDDTLIEEIKHKTLEDAKS
jgi:hypothetical protein